MAPTAAAVAPSPHLGSLLRSTSARRRDRPAVAYGDSAITFGDLAARADQLAASLALEPGDRVALIAPNVPGLVISLFAVWQAGGVAVPLSSRLRRFELERAFVDAEPSAVVWIGPDPGPEAKALAYGTPTLRSWIALDKLGEIVAETRTRPGARAEPLGPEIAAILYTSGTTGEPKGVLVSHALGEAQGLQLAERLGSSADAACGFVVPIPHAFGLACLFASIAAGALAVLVDQTTSLQPLLEAMHRHGGRVLHGTPALFARLLKTDVELDLETGFTAGSACPPEVLAALDRRGMRILNLYGMTEIGAATACRADDPPEVRHHTAGRAFAGYDLRVRDGEIQVRGPFAAGYHKRAWTAQETAGDGWFRTGDLGSLDDDGNLAIAGRGKEVVQVGGFNVFPAEVENFLLTHPDIVQAVVVGVPHPTMGEALRAYVVASPGAQLEPGEVIRFARAGIAGYKVPYRARVVDELPVLPSGKPDRRALAHAANEKPAAA